MKRTNQTEPEPGPGLRERKKQALRGELSLAAVRLATQHGLENVRTEDIVAAVGVSRRTFNNYFANKYEAIADRHVERAQQAAEALRSRKRGETLWQALTAALLAPYEAWAGAFNERSAEERKGLLLMLEDPSLRAEMLKGDFAAAQALTQAIAERTGTDPVRDLYPALVAATAMAALATVRNRWLRVEPPQPLVLMIREALGQIERGLPEPARRKR
jgi:AcrR family transcriptional regulator